MEVPTSTLLPVSPWAGIPVVEGEYSGPFLEHCSDRGDHSLLLMVTLEGSDHSGRLISSVERGRSAGQRAGQISHLFIFATACYATASVIIG